MIDTMEQNKEMTAQESLKLITETMNNNRMEIVRNGGKYYILWGSLLTFFSLLVYILWKTTGNPAWNDLYSQCTNANAKVEAHSRERLGIVRQRITPNTPGKAPVSK